MSKSASISPELDAGDGTHEIRYSYPLTLGPDERAWGVAVMRALANTSAGLVDVRTEYDTLRTCVVAVVRFKPLASGS